MVFTEQPYCFQLRADVDLKYQILLIHIYIVSALSLTVIFLVVARILKEELSQGKFLHVETFKILEIC